jgi:hypothetical protein
MSAERPEYRHAANTRLLASFSDRSGIIHCIKFCLACFQRQQQQRAGLLSGFIV